MSSPKVNASMKEQYADDSPNAREGDRSIATTADEPGNTDAGMSAAAQGGGSSGPSGAPKAHDVMKNSDKYGAVVGNPNNETTDADASGAAQGAGNVSSSSSSSGDGIPPSGAPKAHDVMKNSDRYGAVVGNPNEKPEDALKSKL